MTTYEHLMLSMCFGATMGWFIAMVGMMVVDLFRTIKKKIKARRDKKHIAEEVKTDNE
ncbi:hypothetical protein [Mogibacterium kristiansenii]|uniref:hypothetical protein n=1 Tax=Mogibacterium kristiansenii TaxID=2606708 RepID=UPI00240A2978|nr:hypothetical protein [Mogibacterium kristiansenii]MDD6699473.1 hypothetical protein [Mogibacterium kristiansenii]